MLTILGTLEKTFFAFGSLPISKTLTKMKEKSCPLEKHRKRLESLVRFDLTEKQRRDYADAGYYYPGHGEVLKCIHPKESVPIDRLRKRCQVVEDSQDKDGFKAKQNTLDEYDTENITECNSVGSNIVDDNVSTYAQAQESEPLNIKQSMKLQDPDALRSIGGSRTTGAVPSGHGEVLKCIHPKESVPIDRLRKRCQVVEDSQDKDGFKAKQNTLDEYDTENITECNSVGSNIVDDNVSTYAQAQESEPLNIKQSMKLQDPDALRSIGGSRTTGAVPSGHGEVLKCIHPKESVPIDRLRKRCQVVEDSQDKDGFKAKQNTLDEYDTENITECNSVGSNIVDDNVSTYAQAQESEPLNIKQSMKLQDPDALRSIGGSRTTGAVPSGHGEVLKCKHPKESVPIDRLRKRCQVVEDSQDKDGFKAKQNTLDEYDTENITECNSVGSNIVDDNVSTYAQAQESEPLNIKQSMKLQDPDALRSIGGSRTTGAVPSGHGEVLKCIHPKESVPIDRLRKRCQVVEDSQDKDGFKAKQNTLDEYDTENITECNSVGSNIVDDNVSTYAQAQESEPLNIKQSMKLQDPDALRSIGGSRTTGAVPSGHGEVLKCIHPKESVPIDRLRKRCQVVEDSQDKDGFKAKQNTLDEYDTENITECNSVGSNIVDDNVSTYAQAQESEPLNIKHSMKLQDPDALRSIEGSRTTGAVPSGHGEVLKCIHPKESVPIDRLRKRCQVVEDSQDKDGFKAKQNTLDEYDTENITECNSVGSNIVDDNVSTYAQAQESEPLNIKHSMKLQDPDALRSIGGSRTTGAVPSGHGEVLKCIHPKESVPIDRLRKRCQVVEDSQDKDGFKAKQNTLDEYDTENITECNSVGSNIVDDNVSTYAQAQESEPLNIKHSMKLQDPDALRSIGGSRTTGAVPSGHGEVLKCIHPKESVPIDRLRKRCQVVEDSQDKDGFKAKQNTLDEYDTENITECNSVGSNIVDDNVSTYAQAQGHGEVLKCIHPKESVPIDRLRKRCQVVEDSQDKDGFKAKQNTLDEYDTENITECNSVGSNIVDDNVSTYAQAQDEIESVDSVSRDGKGCTEEEDKPHPEKSLSSSYAENEETKTSQEKERRLLETTSESMSNKQGAEDHAVTDRHKDSLKVQKCEGTIQQGDDKEMANLSKCTLKRHFRGHRKKKESKDFCRDVFCKRNLIDLIRTGCFILDFSIGHQSIASTIVILLIFGIQITDVSSTDTCLKKQNEFSTSVESCPKTADGWNKRAKQKRCDTVSAFCPKDSILEYHCVPIPHQDGFVEVCVKVWNSAGYCIEWNGNGLQDNYDLDCKTHSTPCPSFYFSNMTYKYQECYEMQNTRLSTNTNDLKNSGDEGSSSSPLIIGVTIPIIVVVAIVFACLIQHMYVKRKSKLTEMERGRSHNEEQSSTDEENTESDVEMAPGSFHSNIIEAGDSKSVITSLLPSTNN